MDTKEKKCAHPSCVCMAAKDSEYCSAYCAGQSDMPDIMCHCEHAGCAEREPAALRL